MRLGLSVYAEIAASLGEKAEQSWALKQREDLDARIQKFCWSKDRFIWAIGQDGTFYGTHESKEGAVYLNTQVWAVISGAATPEQARTCMDTLKRELSTEYGVMLCAPAVKTMPADVMLAILFNHRTLRALPVDPREIQPAIRRGPHPMVVGHGRLVIL